MEWPRPVLVHSQDVFNERSGTVIAVALIRREPRASFPLTLESTADGPRGAPGSRSARSEDAEVPEQKVVEYRLSVSHPSGASKARFFIARGYKPRQPQRLIWDLRRLAREGSVRSTIPSRYGTKYLVEGHVEGPNGDRFRLRSLWLIQTEGSHPRLVTAYPVNP